MDKKEQFEYWIFDMSDTLEAFFKQMEEVKDKLDYSIESLSVVEKCLLEQYANVKEALAPKEAQNLNQYAVYIGETIRKNCGGKWRIELEDKDDVYYGLPIITDYCEKPTPECPLTLATTAIHRRKGSFLQNLIQKMYNRVEQAT